MVCSICLSDIEDNEKTRLSTCKHEFHSACIERWKRIAETCPLCREVCNTSILYNIRYVNRNIINNEDVN